MEKLRKNIVFLIIFTGLLFIPYKLVSDNYYFIPTGAEILANGFPHEDFLSMHDGMHLVVPQWMFAVAMNLLYSWNGMDGVYALSLLAASVQIYAIYRLFFVSSENRSLSIGAVAISGILLCPYFTLRPWIISNTILITGIILLEKYIRTGKKSWLYGFPLLSLLLINIHASVFPLFLVVTTVFFLASVIENSGKCQPRLSSLFQLHGKHIDWKPAAAAFVSVLAAAFINPYGYEALIYGAVGVMDTSVVGGYTFLPKEMSPLTIYNGFAFLIYIVFSVAVISRNKVPFRYAVMFALSAAMTLMMYRNLFMLMTLGTMCIMYALKQAKIFDDFPSKVKNPWQLVTALFVASIAICLLRSVIMPAEKTVLPWTYITAVSLLMAGFLATMYEKKKKELFLLRAIIVVCMLLVAANMRYGENFSIDDHYAYVSKPAIDYIELHEENPSNVRIWCSANVGSYAEFRGMKPFYDSRVELYAKVLNGKSDFRNEYNLTESGFIDYMTVFSKYKIDYVLSESDEGISYYRLAQDDRFEMIIDTPQIRLYKLKK